MPSLKSPENAGVLGIRRSSSHRKEVAGSCSRGSGEGRSKGMFGCLKRLASTAERNGERLYSDVAKYSIIFLKVLLDVSSPSANNIY